MENSHIYIPLASEVSNRVQDRGSAQRPDGRECYIAMLEMEDHLQALNIRERQVTVEPT